MSSLYIPLIFLLVSFIIDKVRENNKTKESGIKFQIFLDNILFKEIVTDEEDPVINQQTLTRKSFEKKQRVIVDREKEIFSNSLTFDKEKVVNDIIFSEILSKPKSKR